MNQALERTMVQHYSKGRAAGRKASSPMATYVYVCLSEMMQGIIAQFGNEEF